MEICKDLESAFNLLLDIKVQGEDVERMYAAKELLRRAYASAKNEAVKEKEDG